MYISKSTGKKREIVIRLQRGKRDHELKRKKRRIAIKKSKQPGGSPAQEGGNTPRKLKIIPLPAQFDLRDNYKEVMRTMNKFRNEVEKPYKKRRTLSLNFNSVQHIDIASALVLAANLDVWQMKCGELQSRHNEWHPSIRSLLNQMGLFALLAMPPLDKEPPPDNGMSFVQFLSAQKADGSKAKKLRQSIETTMLENLSFAQRQALFTSLAEALANAKQHAYINPNNLRPYEKWWITAAYNRNYGRKQLTVAIYDRGQTIPATMRKSDRWEHLRARFPLWKNHAELIKIAMQTSVDAGSRHSDETRSRTREPYRGKGMRQLLDLPRIALEKGGEVHIISGNGHCCFALGNQGELTVKTCRDVGTPMRGTLVEWQIDV